MFGRNYQRVTWHCKALFWPRQEGAGNCFPQSLRMVIPSEGLCSTGSDTAAAGVESRQECVCLANLALFTQTGKAEKRGPGVSRPRQLDLLNHFFEPRRRWAYGLGFWKGWGWNVRRQRQIGIQPWFWGRCKSGSDSHYGDELTRFYLREESCSLHWPAVSLVRHMCSWGNRLIQCLGYGTEDLSQSSEPMWCHKLPLKGLRLGSPSVSIFFLQKAKNKDFFWTLPQYCL